MVKVANVMKILLRIINGWSFFKVRIICSPSTSVRGWRMMEAGGRGDMVEKCLVSALL
jgi:hypothetical protein